MSYKGTFKPKNPKKYSGDVESIIYRSLWERKVFQWCDTNDIVVKWSSEEIIVPYICKTDGQEHRYFVDLFIQLKNGKTLLVEIKPHKQTLPPKKPSRVSKKYLGEVMVYGKNTSKWEAAEKYASKRGWHFLVWTEHDLKKLGIKVIG